MYSCSNGSETSSLVSNSGKVVMEDENEGASESSQLSLSRIDVFSSQSSLAVNDRAELTVLGYYSDGSVSVINENIELTASNESILDCSSGSVIALSPGATSVNVTVDSISKLVTFFVFSATLESIEMGNPSIELPANGSFTLSVTANYDNGQSLDVTDQAIFTSDDDSIVDVNSEGLITAISSGTTLVRASFSGLNSSVSVVVSNQTVTSIQVTPIIGSNSIGEQQQFYATALLSDNSTLDITSVASWTSSNESVLSISSSGVANSYQAGEATIEASYQGVNNQVQFLVNNKSITSLRIEIPSSDLGVGIISYVKVIALYDDGTEDDVTNSVELSSSNVSTAIISNSSSDKGKLSAIAIGSSTIQAQINSVSTTTVINVSGKTLDSIRVETKNSLLSAGINAYFSAIGVYSDGSENEITQNVSWSISNLSFGSISNSGQYKGLYYNSFNEASTQNLIVTASLNGVDGALTVLLAPGTINSIAITPSSAIKNTNQTENYKAFANFNDGASVDITDIVTWQSSDTDLALISNSKVDIGLASFLNEGYVSISASYNGLISNNSLVSIDNGQSESVSQDGTGLLASYFNGNNFNTLAGQRVDSQINFNWDRGLAPLGVGDSFSVRWEGEIKGKFTGNCTIASRSDDGFRVYVNNVLVIDVWFPHAPRWDYNYSVPFVEGEKQDLRVEFFENGGHAVAELYWECPGDAGLEGIPTQYLYSP